MKRERFTIEGGTGNNLRTLNHSSVTYNKGRLIRTKVNGVSVDGAIHEKVSRSSFNVLNFVFVIFLFVVIGRAFSVGNFQDVLSIRSFLEFLQTVPVIDMPFNIYQEISVFLPEWLSWLGAFTDFFGSLFNLVWFFITGIVQVITFVVWFLGWVFV